MRNNIFRLIIAVVFFVAPSFNAVAQQPDRIPEFTFFKLDGKPFTKAQLDKSTKTMLIFFDTTCEHCQHEIQDIGKRYKEFKNISFYMVSLDDPAQINYFMNTYGKDLKGKPNLTLLTDKNREFIRKFQPIKFPAVYVYNQQQRLIAFFDGQKDVKELLNASAR